MKAVKTGRTMQLAFHGATSMQADLQTDIEISAKAGFEGLEIWTNKLEAFLQSHSLADLKALFAEHGVKPLTLNSLESISFRGPAFASVKAHCRMLCEVAVAIGSPAIAVIPSPKPVWDISWEAVVDEHLKVLRILSDIAQPYGVKLSFEFLGHSGFTVRTPRGAMEIIQATDRDNIGMVFDIAHFTVGGAGLAEIEKLDVKRIFGFHLDDVENIPLESYTDANRMLPGLGIARTGEICSRIAALGYDGFATVELFRPEYWEWEPLELVKRSHAAALEVLKPHFRVD